MDHFVLAGILPRQESESSHAPANKMRLVFRVPTYLHHLQTFLTLLPTPLMLCLPIFQLSP
jgi:hypothetical protein